MDVTEQAESAARLTASEEHFRVAFENAPIGMTMISLGPEDHGRYLRANAAFESMVGRTSDELVGMPIGELTHPEDRERDAGKFARLAHGENQTVAFEKRYVHKDDSVVHAWITSTVVHGEDGQPLYLVTHAMDISERLREQAELERLALTDTLTGLANRTLLNDRLDQALARLHRTGGVAAMLLLDIDRFKTVNDSLGHQVGDALLVEVAHRVEAVSRADSTVARLGGDEFVVLVEGLPSAETVHAVAARLLETLRRPYDLGPTRRVAGGHRQPWHLGRPRRDTQRRRPLPRGGPRALPRQGLRPRPVRAVRRRAARAGRPPDDLGAAAPPRAGRQPAGARVPADHRPGHRTGPLSRGAGADPGR